MLVPAVIVVLLVGPVMEAGVKAVVHAIHNIMKLIT
jgi:hypothetical protein